MYIQQSDYTHYHYGIAYNDCLRLCRHLALLGHVEELAGYRLRSNPTSYFQKYAR